MIAWFGGDAIVTALSFGNATAAERSIGELGYLGFYAFALRALAALPGLGDSRHERWRVQRDATLAALTVGTLSSGSRHCPTRRAFRTRGWCVSCTWRISWATSCCSPDWSS